MQKQNAGVKVANIASMDMQADFNASDEVFHFQPQALELLKGLSGINNVSQMKNAISSEVISQMQTAPIQQNSNDEDMRISARANKPKVSTKLPDAFNSLSQNSNKLMQKRFNLKADKKGNVTDTMELIDSKINAEKYKQMQGLLSPIKIDADRKERMQKLLDSSFQMPRFADRLSEERRKPITKNSQILEPINLTRSNNKHKQHHRNSLEPHERKLSVDDEHIFLESITQSHSSGWANGAGNSVPPEAKKLLNIPKPRLRSSSVSLPAPKQSIRLEEMITLSVTKGTNNSGPVKKMLHAPSLEIYTVKEVPLWSREIRSGLKELMTNWHDRVKKHEYLVKLYNTFWNVPEGCVSVALEYMNGGSLQNLLESVGALPEKQLRIITRQILQGLKYIHDELQSEHGGLTTSQILFDKDANIKLNLGIASKIKAQRVKNDALFSPDKMTLYNPNPITKPDGFKRVNQINKSTSKSQDIFDLGYLLMIAAVGDLDMFEEGSLKCSHIPSDSKGHRRANSTGSSRKLLSCCCILHCKQSTSQKSMTLQNYFTTSRFSKEFIGFMCECLSFNEDRRPKVEKLLHHPWITAGQFSTPNQTQVSIQELLSISQLWRAEIPQEYQSAAEKQLERICEAITVILPGCDQWNPFEQDLSSHENFAKVRILAGELGLEDKYVQQKLIEAFEMSKTGNSYKHSKQ